MKLEPAGDLKRQEIYNKLKLTFLWGKGMEESIKRFTNGFSDFEVKLPQCLPERLMLTPANYQPHVT